MEKGKKTASKKTVPEKEKKVEPEQPEEEKEKEPDDFSDCLYYHPDTNSYSFSLRWKPLSQLEMVGIAVQLSQEGVVIDTLDLGQTNFSL